MAAVHHRMPVILTPEQVGAWLDPASRRDDLKALLKPLPDEAVSLTPVSKRVNAVREDDRSEEHTSELQSLMRKSYAVFCLKKKTTNSLILTRIVVDVHL